MPPVKAIHFNPFRTHGKTQCGRKLASVIWREDIKDVTCNLCIKLYKKEITFNKVIL